MLFLVLLKPLKLVFNGTFNGPDSKTCNPDLVIPFQGISIPVSSVIALLIY